MRLTKCEFWIKNLIVVLSTVLGVYLAAYTNLETATEFETVRVDRDKDMRFSLPQEINHSISAFKK